MKNVGSSVAECPKCLGREFVMHPWDEWGVGPCPLCSAQPWHDGDGALVYGEPCGLIDFPVTRELALYDMEHDRLLLSFYDEGRTFCGPECTSADCWSRGAMA